MEQIALLVNGAPQDVPLGWTVADLLDQLGLRREGVAVAVDRQVVPRSRHAGRVLAAGEQVEIIIAVGGG